MNLNAFSYHLLNDYAYALVGIILIGLFALLYFSLATSLYLIFNWSLKKGATEKVTNHKQFEHQIRFEIIHSFQSIIVFGLYGLLIVFCYRHAIVSIAFEYNYMIGVDLLILAVWNEVHFYLGHKLMHTKYFIGIHRTHHKSVVVTPFSTYSFHPVESLIFGTVMISPMLVIEFELMALVIFPIYHLFFNTLGHSNVKLIQNKGGLKKIEISTHHNNHHTKFNANFGFASSLMDRLMKTYYKKERNL